MKHQISTEGESTVSQTRLLVKLRGSEHIEKAEIQKLTRLEKCKLADWKPRTTLFDNEPLIVSCVLSVGGLWLRRGDKGIWLGTEETGRIPTMVYCEPAGENSEISS